MTPSNYTGRPLRSHAVAQLTSLLDALGLERVPIVGTSLGGMWALCLALDAPDRVAAVASLGVPAVALPGMHGDAFLHRALDAGPAPARGAHPIAERRDDTPVGRSRRHRTSRRRASARGVLRGGPPRNAPARLQDAMLTHVQLAMQLGRPRPENYLSEPELRQLMVPVLMIWGDEDPYGGPEIGRRACALIPNARLEVIPGRHTPFLDDPERCSTLIDDLVRRVARAQPNPPRPEPTSP